MVEETRAAGEASRRLLAAGEVISHVGPRPQVPLADLARKAGIAL